MQRLILGTLAAACAGLALAQGQPAPTVATVYRGARIVTGPGLVVDGGTLVTKGSVIEQVGAGLAAPPGATIVDLAGATVFAGFIDGHTNLGTGELASFGPDDDEASLPLTPHLRVFDGIDPSNRYIAIARRAGVTAVLSAPGEGNLLAGQSALIVLDGDTPEAMALVTSAAMHGSLGERPKQRFGARSKLPSTRMGEAAMLRQTLLDAQHYRASRIADQRARAAGTAEGAPPAFDAKLDALVPVIAGERPLVIGADRWDDLLTALRIADEFKLRLVIGHGTEAYRIADELAARKVPVILGPASSRYRRVETMAPDPATAARLERKGVPLAFQTGSVADVAGLVGQAREAVFHGLPYDAAVRALTVTPATLFGASDRLGTIEPGKRADFVAFDGDPLRGEARVRLVVIGGRIVEREAGR